MIEPWSYDYTQYSFWVFRISEHLFIQKIRLITMVIPLIHVYLSAFYLKLIKIKVLVLTTLISLLSLFRKVLYLSYVSYWKSWVGVDALPESVISAYEESLIYFWHFPLKPFQLLSYGTTWNYITTKMVTHKVRKHL